MTQRATGFLLAPLLGGLLVFQLGCTDTTELAPLETADELVVVTRNTPTTYYFDGDRASGFDYALVKQFALEQGLSLRIKVAFSLPELFKMLATGEAHIAAAGLSQSPSRDAQFLASIAYMEQQPLLVYKSGGNRPRVVDDLVARDIIVVAGSVHVELLTALKEELPELSWREIHAADSLELMQLITHDKAELAIVDSREFSKYQKWVELFKGWWREGMQDWRARAEGDCIFLCELGPPEYAMTDAQGREMSNRWEEALQIKASVAEIWQELGGDL